MRMLLAALLALAPAVAFGQLETTAGYQESPRDFVFEFNGAQVLPNIDNEPGLTTRPYESIFGSKKMWLFEGELDYELYQGWGTASVGLAAGYGVVFGHGKVANQDSFAPDLTTLRTVPIRVLAVYRFDWLARNLSIPLVPFGKIGLADTIWWSTSGSGDVSKPIQGGSASGGKWGYELAGGLALELNSLDPFIGDEFDRDFGVNHVYLQAQYMVLSANNFGKPGLDLSSNGWLFGLSFEF